MFSHPFHPLETVEEHPKEKESTLPRSSSFIYRQRLSDVPSLEIIEAVAQTADIPGLSSLDSDSWEDLDYRDDPSDINIKQMENLTLEGHQHEASTPKRERSCSTDSLPKECDTMFSMKESLPHPLLQDENDIPRAIANDEGAFKERQEKKTHKRHRRTSTYVDFGEVFSSL